MCTVRYSTVPPAGMVCRYDTILYFTRFSDVHFVKSYNADLSSFKFLE